MKRSEERSGEERGGEERGGKQRGGRKIEERGKGGRVEKK